MHYKIMDTKVIIFSAPSGSGKSTVISWLMKHVKLRLAFSVSCTSRPPRGQERNGVEYFFISPEEFRERIGREEFLEYEEVYADRYYGTLKSQVENQLASGQNVVFDVDVKGAMRIKEFYGDRALSIFVRPPSMEELRRRLERRATDSPEVIKDRIERAGFELGFADKFDCVVVNDDLEKAEKETLGIVERFLGNPSPRKVGVYGGSFNPVHNGHIAIARSFLDKAGLDEVWFVVSPQNPFKANDRLLDGEQRLSMVREALKGEPGMVASDYEFKLPRPSYMWNTLQSMSRDFPGCEFTLLIGSDNWATFGRWYRSADILSTYRIGIFPRRGDVVDGSGLPENVFLLETETIDISSTEVRRRVSEGLPTDGLVPPKVAEIMRRKDFRKNVFNHHS